MKCVHCGRPLTKATVTMPSRNGHLAWGPKCARALRLAIAVLAIVIHDRGGPRQLLGARRR